MKWRRFVLGDLAANAYLLWEEESGEALCVDPGGPVEDLYLQVKKERLKLLGIILTHGHIDHIAGADELRALTGAPVAIHHADEAMAVDPVLNLSQFLGSEVTVKPDRLLTEGDTIRLGRAVVSTRHTPGHTPGGISLLGAGLLFTGDTLFSGGIGRSDLPGGDEKALFHSLLGLMELADDLRVLPGHGQETTIGQERRSNPFLIDRKKMDAE